MYVEIDLRKISNLEDLNSIFYRTELLNLNKVQLIIFFLLWIILLKLCLKILHHMQDVHEVIDWIKDNQKL